MYFVKLFNKDKCIINAPFQDKNKAIKYFNEKLARKNFLYSFIDFDYIELLDENHVLFDSEV